MEDEGEEEEVVEEETKGGVVMVEAGEIMVEDRTAEWLNNRNVLMCQDRNAQQSSDKFQDRTALVEVNPFVVQ